MENKDTNISLQLLLLNDLLRTGTIDKDVYDKAVVRISSARTGSQAT